MYLKRSAAILWLVFMAWSLTAFGADTIRIAYIGILSGPFALVGEDILKSFRGAADMVNAQGARLATSRLK